MRKFTIGTRGSKLALWQSNYIKNLIENKYPDVRIDLNIIKTQGDKILDTPLSKIGGKGLFVKEIENALLDKTADLAVHSMKDVPMDLPDGLELFATPERQEPNDAFLSIKYSFIRSLPEKAVVGTSSLRRKLQILKIRPDLIVKDLRGNVDTRIRKLTEGEFDAIILAKAGLNRLKMTEHIKETVSINDILPAACQGAIGIEIRSDDEEIKSVLGFINHKDTMIRTLCERAFLRKLQGGCQVPIAGYSEINKDEINFQGLVMSLDGKKEITASGSCDLTKAENAGFQAAEEILSKGGDEILKEIYS